MRRLFVTGLVIILPLAVTFAIVLFIVRFLTNPFIDVAEAILLKLGFLNTGFLFLTSEQVLRYGSQLLILLMLFMVTVLIGLIARWFFVHSLIKLGDYVLHRIPFVNKVYKTTQDVIQTVFESQNKAFKQVVMVPFPNKQTWCMGLVTREAPQPCSDLADTTLQAVFVPTTPNPTSGYLLMFPERDMIYLDMHVEDAVKFVMSCGVIHPETFHKMPKKEVHALRDLEAKLQAQKDESKDSEDEPEYP